MKLSINQNKGLFGTNSKNYLQAAQRWLTKTPERALNQAYNSALAIKAIEDKHFNGKNIFVGLNNHSENVRASLEADLEKHLNTIKTRLAEFKASRTIFSISNTTYLEKLALVDEVLAQYYYDTQASAELTTPGESETKKIKNQPRSSVVEIINVEPVGDQAASLPKSFRKTFNKFKKNADPQIEADVIKKFRNSKAKKATAIKVILLLTLVPLLTQQISKHLVIEPVVTQIRGVEAPVFLNTELKEQAFHELQNFEENIKFETLIHKTPQLSVEAIEEQVQHKAAVLAEDYRFKSNSAISNVFADLVALIAFTLIVFTNQRGIITLKSYMDDVVRGLSDSAKAFIIILLTDVFVGFHSSHGWEVLLETVANHWGLPVNRSGIFLFIATFPVMLDAVFKFWIFRYLSVLSPSAAATYRHMNE